MKKFLSFLFFIFFISGCAEVNGILNKDPIYINYAKYTKTIQINNSLETKAIFNITYLNPIFKDSNTTDFIMGIYIDQNNNITNPDYNITLNNKPIYKYKLLSINSKYKITHLPCYNNWQKFYLVSFKDTNSSTLTINIKNKYYGEANVTFQKNPTE